MNRKGDAGTGTTYSMIITIAIVVIVVILVIGFIIRTIKFPKGLL
jgi:preprotein translocase subunit Sss1